MKLVNVTSCGVSVAPLIAALLLDSMPVSSVLAQPSNVAIQPGYSMTANTPWKMLPSRQRTRSAPRNWTRFAAQYLAHGLPCERFTAALASRTSCITRGRGGWLVLPRGGLAPPILCQFPGALAVGSARINAPCAK